MAARDDRREALKQRLMDAAEIRIRESGLATLRARDLAADAGCALGAIYTVFEDMDELVIRVNSRTLARLGALAGEGASVDPRHRLKDLALTYADFAARNTNLWAAVFEHRMSGGKETPDWYRAEHAVLIEQIARPVAALRPSLSHADLLARARTLFSAVHGIVAISIEGRFVGIAASDLRAELGRFVDVLVTGIEHTPDN